jgi:hypothetical protein
MDCPKCEKDLSELVNFDNINIEHDCPGCGTKLFLEYDECCYEDDDGQIQCDDMFSWNVVGANG